MRTIVLAVALLCSCTAVAQDTIKERITEGTAYARVTAAKSVYSSAHLPTYKQCATDANAWDAQTSSKGDVDPYWYGRLSTEELLRLENESTYCVGVLRRNGHRDLSEAVRGSEVLFLSTLLFRAEDVIRDGHLNLDFLLESSE